MNITTRTGLVGFFLALSTLPISGGIAAPSQPPNSSASPDSAQPIESRLTRLTAAIRQRENLLPQEATTSIEILMARGAWGNGGGGGFANRAGRGGFANSSGGGGFVNGGGFRNGGGFWNY